VRDKSTGQITTRQIEIDLDGLNGDDTTLRGLAADLEAVPGITASVTADNRLHIAADDGQEFWFTEDSSGALAALGVASFFDGTDAASIEIDANVSGDPRRIAASRSGAGADGGNAGRVARLADSTTTSTLLGGRSIQDYHEAIISDLAVEAASANSDYEAASAVYDGLYAQREAVSGVSVDEEAINLTKYQQAYQAATRYLSVVNDMTSEIMALL